MDTMSEKENAESMEMKTAQSSADTTHEMGPIDLEAEKKLVRKCDLHVLPIITLLFLFNFVDRINIGNAKIQGLEKDLHMEGHDYNIALFMFFIPYILFEIPSNIILKKVKSSTWLSFIMVCWGIITICIGLTRSFAGLVVCRFLLGLFEAGFAPGCVYLISMYYQRYELQWRWNLFWGGSILAGAFGGLLAYGLAKMAGIRGYNGWRWIFIIEGLATVVLAVIAKFTIVDWPETAKFLNPNERQLLLRRLEKDAGEARMDHLDRKAKRRAFGDWKIYLGILMYIGIVNTSYAVSFFIPTILKQLGWTSVRAQVLSIPIWVAAWIGSLIVALCTDRLRHRYAFAMLGVVVATIGYALLLAQDHLTIAVRYFAVYLVTCGTCITQPVIMAWLSNNMGGHYKRGIGSAMQIGVGNLGGIIASNIYIAKQQPHYPVGFGVSLGLVWLCGLACTIFVVGLWIENRKRDRGGRDYRLALPIEEVENLGDDHPTFRFAY